MWLGSFLRSSCSRRAVFHPSILSFAKGTLNAPYLRKIIGNLSKQEQLSVPSTVEFSPQRPWQEAKQFREVPVLPELYRHVRRLGAYGALNREQALHLKSVLQSTLPWPTTEWLLSPAPPKVLPAAGPSAQPAGSTLPEIAIVGRSNVGKSTLINTMLRCRCAATSELAGTTTVFTCYHISRRICITDTPSLGYTSFPEFQRSKGCRMLTEYLARSSLKHVFLVVDATVGFTAAELGLLELLITAGVPYSTVLNKCDLLTAEDVARRALVTERQLQASVQNIVSTLRSTRAAVSAVPGVFRARQQGQTDAAAVSAAPSATAATFPRAPPARGAERPRTSLFASSSTDGSRLPDGADTATTPTISPPLQALQAGGASLARVTIAETASRDTKQSLSRLCDATVDPQAFGSESLLVLSAKTNAGVNLLQESVSARALGGAHPILTDYGRLFGKRVMPLPPRVTSITYIAERSEPKTSDAETTLGLDRKSQRGRRVQYLLKPRERILKRRPRTIESRHSKAGQFQDFAVKSSVD